MDGASTPQPAETPTTPASAGAPKAEEQRTGKKAKPKRELTPQQRQRATQRQAVSRELEAIMGSEDPEALARAVEALKAARSGAAPRMEAPAAAGEAPVTRAAPAPRPGWPSDDAIARAVPLAQTAVNSVAMGVALLGVDLARPRRLPGIEQPIVLTDMLVKDSAPVIALYAPDVLNTPWGALGLTMLTVATIVVAEAMVAKAQAESEKASIQKVAGAGEPLTGGATA